MKPIGASGDSYDVWGPPRIYSLVLSKYSSPNYNYGFMPPVPFHLLSPRSTCPPTPSPDLLSDTYMYSTYMEHQRHLFFLLSSRRPLSLHLISWHIKYASAPAATVAAGHPSFRKTPLWQPRSYPTVCKNYDRRPGIPPHNSITQHTLRPSNRQPRASGSLEVRPSQKVPVSKVESGYTTESCKLSIICNSPLR